ncbi:MAG TPA: FtsX-like permease family protein [Chloroflexota bacterium]|nr:FtsX-like permease family protein [Chloroflexota bacterium]
MAHILGRRPFLAFGLVTALIVALLAAVNMTSRYALKLYTEDQLARLPWDLAVYQQADIPLSDDVRRRLSQVPGVIDTADLAFLRTTLPPDILPYVDGKPLRTPWVSVLSATSPDLLPQAIRPPREGGAVLTLLGSKTVMGDALLALQGTKQFGLRVQGRQGVIETTFSVPIARVERIETTDVNNWFMDRMSTPFFVPSIGVILVTPYDAGVIGAFDRAAKGIVQLQGDASDRQTTVRGDYYPEVTHVARLNRSALISGWDLAGSLDNLAALNRVLRAAVQSVTPANTLDDTDFVLLTRMNQLARIIALLTILISFPLLWMAWVLMANLSRLLMLNERRGLGLMRLRGVPGHVIGASLIATIAAASLLGGLAGAALGTFVPMLAYERGWLAWDLLWEVQEPRFLALFVAIGVAVSMVVARRFVTYATSISPLEASGRVAASEAESAAIRFGPLQVLALLIGSFKIVTWILNVPLAEASSPDAIKGLAQILDFVGFPLFVYGASFLLASRRRWLERMMRFTAALAGGNLRTLFLNHVAMKPHRVASFLLVMSLMASVSLYPTITSASFADKALRGARVQIGTELQIVLNAVDLVNYTDLQGGLGSQVRAIGRAMDGALRGIRGLPGVRSAGYMVQSSMPGVYMPGYAESGVPLFVLDDAEQYLGSAYYEDELGLAQPFSGIIRGLSSGHIAVSPVMAAFWNLAPGSRLLLGKQVDGRPASSLVSGAVAALPGLPSAAVTDRQSFVAARVDYLNYLFESNAYVVASAGNSGLDDLEALSPAVVVRIGLLPGASADGIADQVRSQLPAAPLSVRTYDNELAKVGSDMFIALATQNMKIYLAGGLLLALISILAIALTNYAEDRRTLALLRIRGAGPRHIMRLFMTTLLSPALAGLLLGVVVALVAGFGMTNLIWRLREIQTITLLLTTHLRTSWLTAWVSAILLALVLTVSYAFSRWAFRQTARESLGG